MKKNKTFFQNLLTYFQNRGIINYKTNRKGVSRELTQKVVKLENLKTLAETVKTQKFTVSNDKIKQTERNALKSDTLDALAKGLSSALQVVGRSKDGIIVAFDNDTEGAIYGVVDIVIKDLSFDDEVDTVLAEFADILKARAEREAKRQANKK